MSRREKHHGRGSRVARLTDEIEFYSERIVELLAKCKSADTLDEKRAHWMQAQRCKSLVRKYQKQLRACKPRCKKAPGAPLFQIDNGGSK